MTGPAPLVQVRIPTVLLCSSFRWRWLILYLELSSPMADTPFIRQCYPVSGDWFVVDRKETRWFIERVVLWSVVESEGLVSHVRAVESSGQPNLNEEDWYFVYGPDLSPAGVTWRVLYDQTAPSLINVREITNAMGEAPTNGKDSLTNPV